MNNKEFQAQFRDILLLQSDEGLDILMKMTVNNKNYKYVVENIVNANNIAMQLDFEINKINDEKVELVDNTLVK